MPAKEEVADMFVAEMKPLIKENEKVQSKPSTLMKSGSSKRCKIDPIKEVTRHKAQETLTLLHYKHCKCIVKPWRVQRMKSPHSLKKQNWKLSVQVWLYNLKTWVTIISLMEGFHQCFILKVENYLEKKGSELKMLLIRYMAILNPFAMKMKI